MLLSGKMLHQVDKSSLLVLFDNNKERVSSETCSKHCKKGEPNVLRKCLTFSLHQCQGQGIKSRVVPHSEVFSQSTDQYGTCYRLNTRRFSDGGTVEQQCFARCQQCRRKQRCNCCLLWNQTSRSRQVFQSSMVDSVISSTASSETAVSTHAASVISVNQSPENRFSYSSIPGCSQNFSLNIPLLRRYRSKLQFVLFPVPKKVGMITCKVRVKKLGNASVEYQLLLEDSHQDILLLETTLSTARGSSMMRRLKRKLKRTQKLDILLGGWINTNIGNVSVSRRSSKATVSARSFHKGYDHVRDQRRAKAPTAQDLSKAPLRKLCQLKQTKYDEFNVSFDGVVEADNWDGMQSMTGFYGTSPSWPYNTSEKKLTSVHASLFNKQSRSLDFLGEETKDFQCNLTSSAGSISVTDKDVTKYVQNQQKPTYMIAQKPSKHVPVGVTEFNMSFSWPTSPLQAFGTFIGLSELQS